MKTLITGMGLISAAGMDLQQSLCCFAEKKRNIGPVTVFKSNLSYPVFEVTDNSFIKQPQRMRVFNFALYAVRQALEDSGLTDCISDFRVGICLGTTVASQLNDKSFYRAYKETGSASMDEVNRFLEGNLSDSIAAILKVKGPTAVVVNACSSGTDAIGVGLSWLEEKVCDIVLCGGADEINHVPYFGFGSLSILNKEPCRPFDLKRSGLNLGEGAGILVLERQICAQKRGKDSNLYVSGYGAAADAYHLTAPHPDGIGLELAIGRALENAGIKEPEIGFVNAHGTGTYDNDKAESLVLKRMFGDDIKFLSTKGFTGHTLGAAGGLEAAFTAGALKEGWIPASVGFNEEDPELGISPVKEKTQINGSYALSTSLGFGGNNSAVVIGKL